MNSTNNINKRKDKTKINMDYMDLAHWMTYLYPFHMGKIYKHNKCKICDETFSDLYNLSQHNNKKHKPTIKSRIKDEREIYESDIECENLQLSIIPEITTPEKSIIPKIYESDTEYEFS